MVRARDARSLQIRESRSSHAEILRVHPVRHKIFATTLDAERFNSLPEKPFYDGPTYYIT